MWVNSYFMVAAGIMLIVSSALMFFSCWGECKVKRCGLESCGKAARLGNNESFQNLVCALFIIAFIVLVVTGICALIVEVGVKSDIFLWIERKDMMQQVVEAGGDLDNISITQTKIEFNNWLASARVELERWGTWSTWWPHKEIIESLEYWI